MQFAINQNYDPADAVIAGVNGCRRYRFFETCTHRKRPALAAKGGEGRAREGSESCRGQ